MLKLIKEDQLQARKEKHKIKAQILTYVIGEIAREEDKDESDAKVLAIVKRTHKRLKDACNIKYTQELHTEICILSAYIPEVLTEEELNEQIDIIVSDEEDYNMGSVMKKLKAVAERVRFSYDGKLASKLVRENIARCKP